MNSLIALSFSYININKININKSLIKLKILIKVLVWTFRGVEGEYCSKELKVSIIFDLPKG